MILKAKDYAKLFHQAASGCLPVGSAANDYGINTKLIFTAIAEVYEIGAKEEEITEIYANPPSE